MNYKSPETKTVLLEIAQNVFNQSRHTCYFYSIDFFCVFSGKKKIITKRFLLNNSSRKSPTAEVIFFSL